MSSDRFSGALSGSPVLKIREDGKITPTLFLVPSASTTVWLTHLPSKSLSLEKELTDTLTARFATGQPWRGPAGETASKLQRELDERWIPYVQQMIKRVDEAQALIDTAEEYERVANSCGAEIKKLISR